MHGTAPLLRSAASVASQTPSRIPHLRCHIALRQGHPQNPRKHGPKVPLQQQRCESTIAQTEYFDRPAQEAEATDEPRPRSHTAKRAKDKAATDEAFNSVRHFMKRLRRTNMFDILQDGFPDRVVSGLMSDSIGTPFIKGAADDIFNKALTTLDPTYFIEPFKEVSRHLKGPPTSSILRTKSIDDRLAAFATYLDRLVAVRREEGKKLDLEACNHLLKCAGSMGDAQLARSVFEVIMPADGVEANLESYNYYGQALLWSHAFSSEENYNLRVIPRNLELRAARFPPKSLSGHKTAGAKTSVQGIRETILSNFKDCTDKGFPANELTFANLMTAMGREADLDGVKSILKSVWNIDVHLLGTYDEEELESPTFYERKHHLCPSETLLFTVAHIFGSNNDLRTAWLLVDYISRNYDIPVTERVWMHLCEWAFLLSLRRSKVERKQGRDTGHISHETFVQMVQAMADEPHNIAPNAVVEFLLSRIWRDKHHLDNAVAHVENLVDIADVHHVTITRLSAEVLEYARNAEESKQPDAFATEEFYNLRRKYMLEYNEFQRSLQLANVAVHRDLLTETDWAGSGRGTEWERRTLPTLVESFTAYLPQLLRYQTKTGTVELSTRYKRLARKYTQWKLDYRILPRILNAMDTEDQVKLNRRMKALPQIMTKGAMYCFNCESMGHTHTRCPNKAFRPSTLDYRDEGPSDKDASSKDGIIVLDPTIAREAIPFELEPGSEKEYSNPTLPFQ